MEENDLNIINEEYRQAPVFIEMRGAGAVRRIAAFVIDNIIMFLVLMLLLLKFFDYFNILKLLNSWAFSSFVFIILFIYQVALMISESFWDGKTPGKYILDIAVRNSDGSKPAFLQLLVRNFTRCTYFIPPLFILPDIICYIITRGKRIGDVIAGTAVIKLK